MHFLPRSYTYISISIEVEPHFAVSCRRNISDTLLHFLLLKELYNCYVNLYACVYRTVVYQNIMYVVFDSIVIFRSIFLLAISNGCAKFFEILSRFLGCSSLALEYLHYAHIHCTNCVTPDSYDSKL